VSNDVVLTADTMERLVKHSNIVGCKLSHGALYDHILIASNPNIEYSKFRTFTGLGQQLLPVLAIEGGGAIDGLAAAFPKTVVKLLDLFENHDGTVGKMSMMKNLQYKISKGEKLVVRCGTIGIRKAVARVAGLSDSDGGRLPFQGVFPDGDKEWERWRSEIEGLQAMEVTL
jgi:2-keto-3-deoxy-L-rhamnonate aldolase